MKLVSLSSVIPGEADCIFAQIARISVRPIRTATPARVSVWSKFIQLFLISDIFLVYTLEETAEQVYMCAIRGGY